MNSKEAVEQMKEIKDDINIMLELCGHAKLLWNADRIIKQLIKDAKEIYEKFKDGCEKDWLWGTEYVQCGCGGTPEYLCPSCKEIKEIWKRIK